MTFSFEEPMPWHYGESKMQGLMHVPPRSNPSSRFLTHGAAYMVQHAPLLALGTLDAENRPWTTIWGGQGGFARPLAESLIGINTVVDRKYDPVLQALLGGRESELVEREGEGRMVGGLTIDLETRKRVKLYGRMIAGALERKTRKGKKNGDGQVQLAIRIDESLPNCPKYLNKKHIVPSIPNPNLISDSSHLPDQAISLLEKADLFFISSSHGMKDMDTNHRGGPPGFVRLLSNDSSGATIVYPEYSGNRLYQTLGNLQTTPLAGITVPDFDTGDVLYMTGRTEVLVGKAASSILPRSNLAVKMTITRAFFVANGLPFRGTLGERSPYNPVVRFATTERIAPGTAMTDKPDNIATLIRKTKLTPTISRFRFRIKDPAAAGAWKPGQYATISFAEYLDKGYSHMRDDDPKSLNDDYLRTFTISSPPSKPSLETGVPDEEFELTIRNVGRATEFLFEQENGFEVPLIGFEGEFRFEKMDERGKVWPFVAGGIGITPVLGQLEGMDLERLRLLWSIGIRDIGLVGDVFEQYPELVKSTTLFVTGDEARLGAEERRMLEGIVKTDVNIERRRIEQKDLVEVDAQDGVDEWYMCVGPSMKSQILIWLARRVAYEDFGY